MAMSVEQFFESYAQVLNRSVGEPEILDAVRAHLADSFVVATPDGLRCGQDGEFTETLRQMLEQCGFRLGVKWPAGPRAARRVGRHVASSVLDRSLHLCTQFRVAGHQPAF